MTIKITKDYEAMSRAAADLVVKTVAEKPNALICFPSGESPAGMFRCLVEDTKAGKVDFRRCLFVGLDEWVGLGPDDDGSCTQFLNQHFFYPLGIKPPQVHFFDAKASDLDVTCREMDEFIKANGPLDLMIVGIGMNGHIGLNEPGTDFNLYAHHAPLDPITATVGQKYFKKETTLTEGITLGLQHFREAKTPLLLASGGKKAEIVARALNGEISEQVPATILQTLPSALIYLDEAAAARLNE